MSCSISNTSGQKRCQLYQRRIGRDDMGRRNETKRFIGCDCVGFEEEFILNEEVNCAVSHNLLFFALPRSYVTLSLNKQLEWIHLLDILCYTRWVMIKFAITSPFPVLCQHHRIRSVTERFHITLKDITFSPSSVLLSVELNDVGMNKFS